MVMVNDPIGDMITRIRNAQRARMSKVVVPASRMRERVLEVLKSEGYIRDFERSEVLVGKPEIAVALKYYEGEPVIKQIQRISTPGRRVYSSIRDLPKVCNGLGIAILSTPRGVMSDSQAREQNVGGEVLCSVL
jgi:small subunit ribosomal protein S8